MQKEEIQAAISTILPAATLDAAGEWLSVLVEPGDWLQAANAVRKDPLLQFNYLFCVTCIDWKSHLEMVYHISSTIHRGCIAIKIKLGLQNPEIESVAGIWRTAEFHEREVFEMFGVKFMHHPDLRLLILPEGWEGRNPMRKDFDDPVNMIRL